MSLSWVEEKWILVSCTPSPTKPPAASIKSHMLNHEKYTFTFYLFKALIDLSGWVDSPDAFLTKLKSICRAQTSPRTHCATLVRAGSGHRARLLPAHASLPTPLCFPESQPTHLTQAETGQTEISWLLAASIRFTHMQKVNRDWVKFYSSFPLANLLYCSTVEFELVLT